MEAAGIALVFLSLVVSALPRRKACLLALKRFYNPIEEAERFVIMFDVQTNIFQSHCRQLLKIFLLKDQRQRLDDIFGDFEDAAWKNTETEARLAQGLGDNYKTYKDIVSLIDRQLHCVHEHLEKLENSMEKEEMVSCIGSLSCSL